MLVPHLDEWVLTHSKLVSEGIRRFVSCKVDANRGGRDTCILEAELEIGVLQGPMEHGVEATSVQGLYEGSDVDESFFPASPGRVIGNTAGMSFQQKLNDELILKCPISEEFGNIDGEWWWFTLRGVNYAQWWVIVDYSGKKMWANMKMRYWDDVWEAKAQKLGPEKDAFRENWQIKERV